MSPWKTRTPGVRRVLRTLGSVLLLTYAVAAVAQVEVGGELKRWHPVSITFDGPDASEDGTPNPFLDYRLNVAVTAPSGATLVVPGFFAADGDAANTSATSGSAWRVLFTPSETGRYTFVASFRTGPGVAVSLDAGAGSPTAFDGATGAFTVAETDKAAPDFRGRGVLRYAGERYYRFDDGSYFVKGGAGSPENFLGYYEFDGTEDHGGDNGALPPDGLHHYDAHLGDWRAGDPTWQGGRGKRIIGAVDYLAAEGVRAQYFLTMNVEGDGQDVYPFTTYDSSCGSEDCRRYDVSKLAQWDVVFAHMQAKGILLHVVTQERENGQLLDGGDLGTARKLYYRELVARFGYHPALVWNLGEETANTVAQLEAFADYFHALDPYDHPVVVHTRPDELETYYGPLLGYPAIEGASIQLDAFYDGYDKPEEWVRRSADAGRPWVVTTDESGGASDGCTPDGAGNNHDRCRGDVLWANLFAGGAGVEWYFGYDYPDDDLDLEDYRSRDRLWDYTRFAVAFVEALPFADMHTVAPGDVGADDDTHLFVEDATGGGWARAAVYVREGTDRFDLPAGEYTLRWFDPRNGGALQVGERSTLEGGPGVALGDPPDSPSEDWVALLTRGGAPGGPHLDVVPSSVDFGAVVVGGQATRALRLRNTGTQPLTVSALDLEGGAAFALVAPPALPLTLAAGEEEALDLRFAPTGTGAQAATLTVASDDPDAPAVDVPLSGVGVDEPGDLAVVAFTLVDADTDEDLGPLVDGATLNLGSLPEHLTVRADTSPEVVGSVRFALDGDGGYAMENDPPYALAGDAGGDYHPWTLDLGDHTLTATPYPEADGGGEAGLALTVAFSLVLSTSTPGTVPDGTPAVYPPRPNPAHDRTTLAFDLPAPSPVRLRLYDARGGLVTVLLDAPMGAGTHWVEVPLAGLASGLYLCRLEVGDAVFTEKVLLLR